MKSNILSTDTLLPDLGAGLAEEFISRLHTEEYLDQIDHQFALTDGERQHLETLFKTVEHRTSRHFDKVIFQHWRDKRKQAEALPEASQPEEDMVREFHRSRMGTGSVSGTHALGNILVANGQITRLQLEDSLRRQVQTGRRLGQELIESGHASKIQVERGLSLQRRLMGYALAITVGLTQAAQPVEAAQASAAMPVSVTVIANARMHTHSQSTQLTISEADVARGYVDITGASQFSVSTNSRSGYLLDFNPVNHLFVSVLVSGLNSTVQLGADGGSIIQREPMAQNHSINLSFRFTLNQDVKPGSYSWPLLLSVRAL
jgi:hypothetical protein